MSNGGNLEDTQIRVATSGKITPTVIDIGGDSVDTTESDMHCHESNAIFAASERTVSRKLSA